ncbi:MAG TPA: tRNA (guanine(26)-N(2))-dimethyltransferase [Thermoplasmata archaeon]|nr:tRNA (guanine(26)-N(2))-dimethyltransferase [Thermoplasmata archaeon]
MTHDFSLTIIKEGTTELIVPADHASSGPSSASMPVFYNPKMEFSRDMSVAVLSHLLPKEATFLDGMAATGARGIRVYRESESGIGLFLNDGNPRAVELIEKNLQMNDITDAVVTQQDLRTLLMEGRYDCVDIDPFGSPAPFFPMAVGAVRNEGVLCVTATDTGTISGIFSSACLRKYGSAGKRTPFCHELGVRNLVGFVAREAARQDVGIQPIVSYYADHYVRTYVRIKKGAKKADESLRRMGYCAFDQKTLERKYQEKPDNESIGPIWIGATCDPSFMEDVHLPPHLKSADRITKVFEHLGNEAMINRPHFSVDEFARRFKIDPPKMDELIERLQKIGCASRTHYAPKTFATDADVGQIAAAMR